MKTVRSQSVSTSKEVVFAVTTGTLILTTLTSCDTPKNTSAEAFKTMTPDMSQLTDQRQRAIEFIGGGANEKYVGPEMSSFQVTFPAEADGSKPESVISGTIFEIKSNLPENLPLSLALYVPDAGDKAPVPVVINHLSADPNSLAESSVPDENGVPVTRYGVAAIPLDEQYFNQIIDGGLTLTPGSFDRYLKKNADGEVVPLYSVWFKDINPDNVAAFVEELSQEQNISKVQAKIMEHIYGVTFNDSEFGRSMTMRLENNDNRNDVLEFLVNTFFAPNMVAHAAPAEGQPTAVTPGSEATDISQYISPDAVADFKATIGDAEYAELAASIGANGEMTAADYADYAEEQKFDGTIVPESMTVRQTADWHYKTIIVAEAQGKDGKTGVVWNPDTNKWVVSTYVNPDIMDMENYTSFNDIDKMIKSGDFNLVILSQGDFAEPFPDNVEKPAYWMTTDFAGIMDGSKTYTEYFFYLDSSRSDHVIPENRVGQENYMDIASGAFTKGNEPYRPAAIIKGKTSEGKDVYIVANIMQNADGTNIINPLGMDPRLFGYITGPESQNNQGKTSFETVLLENLMKLVPIIPTGHPEDWTAQSDAGFGNGNNHGILFVGGISYADDVVVDMQNPGEVFNVLPDYMREQLEENLAFIKANNPTTDKYRAYQFTGGNIPPELALMLSRNIFEAGFTNGSVAPQQ